jgi:hypothetical protein
MRGTIRGIRVEETTGTTDKKVAEEIRAKREAKILEQSIHGRVATVTFAEAALSYIDHGGSKRFLDKVVEHFTTTPLAKIDQEAIDKGAASERLARDPQPAILYARLRRDDACGQAQMVLAADPRASQG